MNKSKVAITEFGFSMRIQSRRSVDVTRLEDPNGLVGIEINQPAGPKVLVFWDENGKLWILKDGKELK